MLASKVFECGSLSLVTRHLSLEFAKLPYPQSTNPIS